MTADDSPCSGDLSVRDLADRVVSGLDVTPAAEVEIASRPTADPDEGGACRGCGGYGLTAECEPSPLCHDCAHLFARALGRIVLRRAATVEHEARHKEARVTLAERDRDALIARTGIDSDDLETLREMRRDVTLQIARVRAHSGDPEFPAIDDDLERRLAALQAVLGEDGGR